MSATAKTRRIELKDLGNGFLYKDILVLVAGSPDPGKILDYGEIVRRGTIADEIRRAESFVELTDDQHALLLRLAQSFNWSVVSYSGVLNGHTLDCIRQLMTELENVPVSADLPHQAV